jgi:hypothetical protein
MHNFEEKLEKLKKQNKEHAGQLQLYDLELPGHHHGHHRQALSWNGNSGVNASPAHFDNSNHAKDPILSITHTNHIDNTTHGALSEKVNHVKSTFDTKRVGLSSSQESRQLTKRLVSSLNIKKHSDLHLQLENFSNQLYGISKKEETKKVALTSLEKSERVSSPTLGTFVPQSLATEAPMITLASYLSNRVSLVNVFQGLQTTRESSLREVFTAREPPQQSKKMAGEKLKVNSGPFMPNKALLAKKKERVALDSFKKIREINHMYATSTGSASHAKYLSQNNFFTVKYIESVAKP